MKVQILLTFLMLQLATLPVLSQQLKGKITDANGNPLPSTTVINTDRDIVTQTDANGDFAIIAQADDELQISRKGFGLMKLYKVTANNLTYPMVIVIERSQQNEKGLGAISAESYWVGAKLGYNFDGFSEDGSENFIGAAKVMLNIVKEYDGADEKKLKRAAKGTLGIIGNVADFISNQNREDATKNLQNITLSVQGFGVGLYGGWILNKYWGGAAKPDNIFRLYGTTGYRLNTFKNVGSDSVTVNLSQFRTSIGLEFEGISFTKGGKMNFSFEVTGSVFDKSRYAQVFNEKKDGLLSCEFNAILPLNENFGFYSSGTFAPNMKAIYQLGIIIKQSN